MVESVGPDHEIRVGGSTSPTSLASAISHALYDNKKVSLRAVGAQAVNQAVKGAAIARGYVAQRGMDLSISPGFLTVEISGEARSAIILRISVS